MIRCESLDDPQIRHGFFTRSGGVSDGIFASLNCGLGTQDTAENVAENRSRALTILGLPGGALVTCRQVHGASVSLATKPWSLADRPQADAIVTRHPGLTLGILTADCAPVLFADTEAGIIAAAHAGWRGALGGVLEATVTAMEAEGANRFNIHAAIGPCIGRDSYEVGPEFPAPFLAQSRDNIRFFREAPRSDHFLFDLAGYAEARLSSLGLRRLARTGGDTATETDRFFSYRRSSRVGEHGFGHMLSAICLSL